MRFPPLSPTTILRRSAEVFATRTAVVDADRRLSYAELGERVDLLAGALRSQGVLQGDRVAVLAPNTHVALEATLGVPQSGGVLLMINIRLSVAEVAAILAHAEPVVLIVDAEFVDLARRARAGLAAPPAVVVAGGPADEYEAWLAAAEPYAHTVADEADPIALNYTSGTTGRAKGAMYHHRGAYLQALSMAYHAQLTTSSVYLWTLPMFHCNGWCFPWAVTLAGATHVCLPKVEPARIWSLLRTEAVTHASAAPTVLNLLVNASPADRLDTRLRIATGGSPPSPALLERAAELNIDILHLYGMTETFGPSVLCDWQPQWDELPIAEVARRRARQGVSTVVSGELRIIGADGDDVARDGATIGEMAIRGNTVMLGYYRDEEQTRQAVPDGFLRTGDLAVRHPDGYVEIRDRSKDVIISGGENIASVEVEQTLASHPAVLEVAVVACPHPRWGEAPVAYVQLKDGAAATQAELIDHVKVRLARFKAPRLVVFGELPRTATGKIQKFRLREQAAAAALFAEDAQ